MYRIEHDYANQFKRQLRFMEGLSNTLVNNKFFKMCIKYWSLDYAYFAQTRMT